MTLDLERLAALEAEATPTPWNWDTALYQRDGIEDQTSVQVTESGWDLASLSSRPVQLTPDLRQADAALIAEARNALPELIASSRRAGELEAALAFERAEYVAKCFHTHYERLAPDFGYETRPGSSVAWADVPEPNKSLMVAVAGHVLRDILDQATGWSAHTDPGSAS